MTIAEHQTHLAEIFSQAQELKLIVRLHCPGDLMVIGCLPSTKPQLTALVESARTLQLAIKWCNEGSLVTIAVPTQKPGTPINGKESLPENSKSST